MVTLTITVDDTGLLQVSGPIENLGLCYQLLELGKDAVRAHQQKAAASPIIAVPAGVRLVP